MSARSVPGKPRFFRLVALLATFAVVGLLAACGGVGGDEGGSGDTRTVETHYGPVDVPTSPQRIVAVAYDTPWQLQSLGITPVGAQDYSSYADSYTAEQMAFIEPVTPIGTYGDLDLEAIANLAPDLIVGDAYDVDEDVYNQLKDIAPTAIVYGAERGDWKPIVDGLAEVVGAQQVATDSADAYNAKIAELRETYAGVLENNAFALITISGEPGQFSILYPSGTTGALYEELGVRWAPTIPQGDFPSGFEYYSNEQIDEYLSGADVIIAPAKVDGGRYEQLQPVFDSPLFRGLPAAQNNRVFEFSFGVTDYVTGLEYLNAIETNVLSKLPAA